MSGSRLDSGEDQQRKTVQLRVDAPVWIPVQGKDEKEVFEQAQVVSIDDAKHECTVTQQTQSRTGVKITLPISQVQLMNPRVVADMTSLYHINDAGILHNLKMRSEQDLPYTNMGSVLVSVNPLHSVPDPDLGSGRAMQTSVPHPYSIAETAFRNMAFCYDRRQQLHRQLEIMERGGRSTDNAVELVVNQSVVISGESGSGKTEAGKRVLRHLVSRSLESEDVTQKGRASLDSQLAGVGPILESFGNASTVCNHNSSRFGKFSKLHFQQRSQTREAGRAWALVGATVETYLLEQSRVVAICEGERNFHVFYQLVRGASAELRTKLGLAQDPKAAIAAFRTLRVGEEQLEEGEQGSSENQAANGSLPASARRAARRAEGSSRLVGLAEPVKSAAPKPTDTKDSKIRPNVGATPGIRKGMAVRRAVSEVTEAECDVANFALLKGALLDIGKKDEEVDALLQFVAGVLHLGNVSFETCGGTTDAAKVTEQSRSSLSWAAKLLGVPVSHLDKLLLERELKAGAQTITAQLDVTSARYARDALCKWAYGTVFDWLVGEINRCLMKEYYEKSSAVPLHQLPFIGVLDIFGFESFTKNGFEQLLINYTNESLQSTFNYQVFVAEADLYKREGLVLANDPFVCPQDDGDCLDLFEGKAGVHSGLLTEIDAESRAPKPTDDKLNRRLHQLFQGIRSFPKPHPKDVASTFLVAHYAGVVQYTIGDFVTKNNDRIPAAMNERLQQSTNIAVKQAFAPQDQQAQARKKTVVANFGGQIRSLVDTLESTKCSFIRCVKPNPEMVWAPKTNWFNCQYVNEQLKCLSIPQTAAVLRSGLPTRIDYDSIVAAYEKALPVDALSMWRRGNVGGNKQSGRTFCAALFWAFKVPTEAFRLGLTKVFFSSGMIDLLDRIMSEAAVWAADDTKGGGEKKEIGRRFKLYYARMRWRRAYSRVVATNRFLRLLHDSRKRSAAARTLQGFATKALFRTRLGKQFSKRRAERAEKERKRKQEESERNDREEKKAQQLERAATNKLSIDPRSSPRVSSHKDSFSSSGGLPPLPAGAVSSMAGHSHRHAHRSSQKISTGWSLQGMLRTPRGSLNPEFVEIVEAAQVTLQSQNLHLAKQNEKLVSDLESLKQDIALLKKTMPFTHILHIY